jgi:uncharacterized membrane protein YtjA (UPF0391 family)
MARQIRLQSKSMLRWAFIFLIVAIVAGILGFTDVEFVSATLARVLFGTFLFGFLLIVLFGFILGATVGCVAALRAFCESTGLCATTISLSRKQARKLYHFEPFLWRRNQRKSRMFNNIYG